MLRKLKRLNKKRVEIPANVQEETKNIYPLAGYIFLLFTFLVDYPGALFPLQLFNPEWEFQTISKIVNTVWAPFLGFSLIFFTRKNSITALEKRLLAFLSWVALFLGVIFILFIPLIFADSNRINANLQSQFNKINDQQLAQISALEKRFQEATPQQLESFFKSQPQDEKTANLSLDKKKYVYLEIVKAQQLQSSNANKSQLLKQKSKLKKDSLGLGIGSILGAILLINVWRYARWTRVSSKKQ